MILINYTRSLSVNNVYDLLFSDLEGTKLYDKFLKKHIQGQSVLEFASGTGDLLNLLDQKYDVLGVDIDEEMISKAILKYPHLKSKMVLGDFMHFEDTKRYDTCVCVGDSLNYMTTFEDMDAFVKTSSALSDHIIVDFHHPYRLEEFDIPYYEEGTVEDLDYAYQIEKDDDHLVHTINFLDGHFEQVIQWVFMPETLIERFENKGYQAYVFTDFDNEGILKEGEKIMVVFSKVNS